MEVVAEECSNKQYKIFLEPETVAEFEQWEACQSGDENYEFRYGKIVKQSGIRQSEVFVISILLNSFSKTLAQQQGGNLFAKIDVYIDTYRKRVADLAFFSRKQILSAAKGMKEVPAFVIELLTEEDLFFEVELKVNDYFDAGVQLVWYISSDTKRIFAFTPKNKVRVFVEGDIATADPALPDFKVEVDKLFTPA